MALFKIWNYVEMLALVIRLVPDESELSDWSHRQKLQESFLQKFASKSYIPCVEPCSTELSEPFANVFITFVYKSSDQKLRNSTIPNQKPELK